MVATRVLVIEDEADLRSEVVDFLSARGHAVAGVPTLADMHAALAQAPSWQVLVLDLMLPDGDGLDAARVVRQEHGLDIGIVITTARGLVDDRIQGLSDGADAYLVKPVDPRELCAQIDRLALRLRTPPAPLDTGWALDEEQASLYCPCGAAVVLTGSELILMRQLLAQPGQPVDRPALCGALGHDDSLEATRRLDTLVSRLRAKVRQQTATPLPVRSFRNLGYAFTGRLQ